MEDQLETPDLTYANGVMVTAGPFDVVMDFTFRPPEGQRDQTDEYDKLVARIAMSPGHAKAMIPLLAKMVATYEEAVGGVIPSPGFEETGKN